MVEQQIAAQVKSATGLNLVSSGEATFSALPPRITVGDVSFVDDPHSLSVKTRKRARPPSLLPLLAGRLEIAEATLCIRT